MRARQKLALPDQPSERDKYGLKHGLFSRPRAMVLLVLYTTLPPHIGAVSNTAQTDKLIVIL